MSEEVETLAPSAGVEEQSVAPPTTTPIEQDPADGQPETEIQATGETEEQPEETEVDLDAVPESTGDFAAYKPLFKEHPELRTILGQHQAYSSIAPNGSFTELKGIVDRVPTLSDAETLASEAESHRAMGETYRSDPAGFIESLRENDALAFGQLADKLPEILAETAPNLYRQQAQYYSNAVLDNLFSIAQQQGNSEALNSIQVVAQMLGVRLGMPRALANQPNSEVERLRKELQEREKSDSEREAVSFWETANQEYTNSTTAEIESVIRKSLPTVTDEQLTRMAKEVWEGVNSLLSKQPQTMSQIERYKRSVAEGKMRSIADHRAIVEFSAKRAKMLIPNVWKEVSSVWSKQIVSANREQIEKKNGIAAKTAGKSTVAAPGSRAAEPARRNPVRDFDSIFEAIKSGNYRKPVSAAR